MEVYFEDALQFPDDGWGPTGYISNEMTPPFAIANTDMISSNIRYDQGGTFLLFDQSAEADEGQDATENEDEEMDQLPSSRRRFD
jgi:hypothetical protein